MEQNPFGKELVAGNTWSWTVTPLAGYGPGDGYTLKYFFRGLKVLDAVATNSNGIFKIAKTATETAVLTPGTYAWQAVLTNGAGDKIEIGRGTVEILADLEAQVEGYDGRSWVKKTLDAIRANLTGLCGREDQQYQINGRMLQTMRRTELLELEGEFAARYRREQIEAGELPEQTNQVQVSFGDPTSSVLQRQWKNFPGNSA